MRKWTVVGLAAAVLLVAACASAAPTPTPLPTPTATPTPTPTATPTPTPAPVLGDALLIECIEEIAGEGALAGVDHTGEMPLPLLRAYTQCEGGLDPNTPGAWAHFTALMMHRYSIEFETAMCIADNLAALGVELSEDMAVHYEESARLEGPVKSVHEHCTG